MSNPYPLPATPVIDPNAVIPTPDSAFNARSLANTGWALAFAGIQNVSNNTALLFITYLGAGRFVGADVTVGAPVAGTGLTLRQPNAALLVNGRAFVVNNPDPTPYQVVTAITPNKPGGVEVFVGIDPDTGVLVTKPEWQFDTYPTSDADLATVFGLLHLGRAVTSASTVTSFTASTVQRQGIISPPGTLSGTGEPATGDDADIINALAARVSALETSQAIQDADIATLKVAQSDAADDFPTVEDQMADEVAINRAGLAEVNPPAIERGEISVVVANAGHGQNDTPDYTPTTGNADEMPFNLGDGTFGS